MTYQPGPESPPSTAFSWVSSRKVSILPREHKMADAFAVEVASINGLLWGVRTADGRVWRADTTNVSYLWQPHKPEWTAKYGTSLTRALDLAWNIAAKYTVNGRTALDWAKETAVDWPPKGESNDEHVPVDRTDVVPGQDPETEGGVETGAPYTGAHRAGD